MTRRAPLALLAAPLLTSSVVAGLLSGCGGSTSAPAHSAQATSQSTAAGSERVAFRLHGGSSATLTACGLRHHYRAYRAGASIAFSGAVTPVPAARWKVKLKVKVCRTGGYADLTKLRVPVNRHTGSFAGRFAAPAPGLYEATARLYAAGAEVARSVERHFRIS